MSADFDLTVPATTRGLADLLQALEAACARDHVEEDVVSRVRIVVEELFTNTMKYGYGGECDRPVRVTLTVSEALTLVYEDEAPRFDPTAWRPAQQPERLADRRVGEAGIAMILGLAAATTYARLANRNRITIVLAPP